MLFLMLSMTLSLASCIEVIYDYESNEKGPRKWSTLFPNYCSGRKQSPINIDNSTSVYDSNLVPYKFMIAMDKNFTLTFENDGHKIEALFPETNSPIKLGLVGSEDVFYTALQIHWHWGSDNSRGSEHTLDGKAYPMEGHMVFWNSKDFASVGEAVAGPGGLAVVGVFYEISDQDNPLLSKFEPALANASLLNKDGQVSMDVMVSEYDLVELYLPKNTKSFYRYEGSLTTPKCTENVLWTVFSTPVPISERQLGYFRGVNFPDGTKMTNNYRPPQDLNPSHRPGAKRVVYKTFTSGASLSSPSLVLTVLACIFVVRN